MTYKSQLGKLGENIACEYLVKNNYKIIERNFLRPWGELDIITKSPDKTLVFIEVKTINGDFNQAIQPEQQLSTAKLKRLKKTASLYAGHYQELTREDKGWRIDLIALNILDLSKLILNVPDRLTNIDKYYIIKHYENVVL